jgi:hypothetical protein
MAARSRPLPPLSLQLGVQSRERLVDLATLCVCVGAGALAAAYVAHAPWGIVRTGGFAAIAVLVLGAGLAVGRRWPLLVLAGGIVLLSLIPNYGLAGFPARLVSPGLTVLWVVVVASFFRRGAVGLTPVDYCAIAIFGGMILSRLAGAEATRYTITMLWMWVGPYLAGRYAGRAGRGRTVLYILVLAGLLALPFALIELTSGNVFIKAFPGGSSSGIGEVERRFGRVRSEGALGQPIPYSMFLSTIALAAIGVWFSRPRRSSGLWLLLAAGVFVAVMTTALARTGWIVLAVGAAMLILLSFKALDTPRNRLVLIAGVAIALVGLSLGPTRNLLFGGGEASQLKSSNEYRKGLLTTALTPGTIKTFGEAPKPKGAIAPSIDNGYLLMALRWGYIPLIAMLLLIPAVLALAWRARGDLLSIVIYGIAVANLVALFGVALMTQSQIIVFFVIGLASGHGLWLRHAERASNAQRVRPVEPLATPVAA